MPYQINVTPADCEAASGEPGLKGTIQGLRLMQAWAETHAPGWRYIAGLRRFQFQSLADVDRFAAQFVSETDA